MRINRALMTLFAVFGVSNLAVQAKGAQFTIAVIPDTQNYIDYSHQTAEGFKFDAAQIFLEQMRFIADNTEENGGDIAFVTALGDVWQHQTKDIDPEHEARGFKWVRNPIFDPLFPVTSKVTTVEIPTARKGYEMIAGRVPFSVVPGNHDYDAMWTDARHPAAAVLTDMKSAGITHAGGLDNFRSLFGADKPFFKGKSWYVSSHAGGADSAQIFKAGGYTFLHIGLSFDAPNTSLEWAAKVIGEHPGLPTVITTHNFLSRNGERASIPVVDNHAVDPQDNTPQMIWDKLISQHDQIFLVLCGHQSGQAMRVDENFAGNKVWQVLSDYQDRKQVAIDAGATVQRFKGIGDGWMRLMKFDMSSETPVIHVQTYSTHYKMQSGDAPQYAAWYKAAEKPTLTDEQFHGQDDYQIDLIDFRKRFGPGSGRR